MIVRAACLLLTIGIAPLATSSVASAPLPVVGDELEQIQVTLRDQRTNRIASGERQRAVRRLAEIATRPAWELLIGTLEDPSSTVADEAQFLLAEVRDPELVEDLFGKLGLDAKETWTPLRVAEAFGRMQLPLDSEDLAKALSARDAEVRRTLLWSVERAASQGRVEGEGEKLQRTIQKLFERDREPMVRGGALLALAALDADAAWPLVRAAATDDAAEVRCAAALVSASGSEKEAAELLGTLAGDKSRSVRVRAIDALGSTITKEGLRVLVQRLEAEPRLRLRWAIAMVLQELSGLKFKLDPRPWRDWVDGLPETWRPGAERHSRAGGESTVSFAGLPILSDRITFLIDLSGSIWSEREDGRTVKDRVDEALERALAQLPEDALFNVIPYTDDPLPWQGNVVPASPRNVEKALRYMRELGGEELKYARGNFFDAAVLAMEDPEAGTLIALTDGAPTGGHRWKMDLMVPLLLERNRYRSVSFDSILVDCPRGLARHWQELAEASGGTSIALELE